eukprot:PhF_6_TR39643/c1_g1_i1/m.58789
MSFATADVLARIQVMFLVSVPHPHPTSNALVHYYMALDTNNVSTRRLLCVMDSSPMDSIMAGTTLEAALKHTTIQSLSDTVEGMSTVNVLLLPDSNALAIFRSTPSKLDRLASTIPEDTFKRVLPALLKCTDHQEHAVTGSYVLTMDGSKPIDRTLLCRLSNEMPIVPVQNPVAHIQRLHQELNMAREKLDSQNRAAQDVSKALLSRVQMLTQVLTSSHADIPTSLSPNKSSPNPSIRNLSPSPHALQGGGGGGGGTEGRRPPPLSPVTIDLKLPKSFPLELQRQATSMTSLTSTKAPLLLQPPHIQNGAILNLEQKVVIFVLGHRVLMAQSQIMRNRRGVLLAWAPKNPVHNSALLNKLESWMKTTFHDKATDFSEVMSIGMSEVNMKWKNFPTVGLGAPMRERYFVASTHIVNFSHSHCFIPTPVMEARKSWEMLIQQDPVIFRFRTLSQRMKQTLTQLALKLYFDPNDGVLLSCFDATISTIVRSQAFTIGDRVLLFTCDPMAPRIAHYLLIAFGVDSVWVNLPFPCSNDFIVECVRRAIGTTSDSPLPKLAFVPSVAMPHMWPLPVAAIADVFRSRKISLVLDATELFAAQETKVCELPGEYVVVRLQELLYCYPGVTLLCTVAIKQPSMSPLIVSYFHGAGYEEEFSYTGLQDTSSILCTLQALEFISHCAGGRRSIRSYCKSLAKQSVNVLCTKWKTKVVQWADGIGHCPVVLLPRGNSPPGASATATDELAQKIQTHLADQRKIIVDVVCLEWEGEKVLGVKLYCRMYNHLAEVERLADAIVAISGAYDKIPI